jgi:hypothetical protein
VGLGFIGCWQSGLQLVSAGHAVGALLDPFGNAALIVATASWDTAARSTLAMPISTLLLANRLVWLSIAGALVIATLRWWHPRIESGAPAAPDATARPSRSRRAAPAALALLPELRGASATEAALAELRFGWHWVTHERGFAALLFIALLNAVANGWSVSHDPTALVRALEFHARLFAILIATIYAGELVWRDRDVRADALFDALPVPAWVRLTGRAGGVALALLTLPVLLTMVALVLPKLTGASAYAPLCSARWILGIGAPAFLGLLTLSLAVHRMVNHKTVAHLLVISAWVLAIALGADALARPWSQWGSCGGNSIPSLP